MIQRIQTVFLIISIAITLCLAFLPLGHFSNADQTIFTLINLKSITGDILTTNWLLIVVMTAMIITQSAAIFSYQNRVRQIKLARLSLVILVALVVLILLYGDIVPLLIEGQSIPEVIDFSYSIGLYVLPWLFTYLAIRAIRKDEALIRSADRLR